MLPSARATLRNFVSKHTVDCGLRTELLESLSWLRPGLVCSCPAPQGDTCSRTVLLCCRHRSSVHQPGQLVVATVQGATHRELGCGLTFWGCELNIILLAEGGWEDGMGGGVVAEPVCAVCGGPPVHTDHQVTVQENLGGWQDGSKGKNTCCP